MVSESKNYHLRIEPYKLFFQSQENIKNNKDIVLNIGNQSIAESFFKHEIPTIAEIDYAINFIEDELMSDRNLRGEKGVLLAENEQLAEIFRKNGLHGDSFSRKGVEELFSSYAKVIMGAPSSSLPTEITRIDMASLLILREIMHHLDFQTFRLMSAED